MSTRLDIYVHTYKFFKYVELKHSLLMDYNEIEITLLRKLFNNRIIGSKHTEFSTALRGFHRSDAGDVKKCLEKLIKDGLILQSKKTGEQHISLNHKRIGEIKAIINI